jgi:hypothetical protein
MADQKSPNPARSEAANDKEIEVVRERSSRRKFIRNTLISGIALTSTGILASKVSTIVVQGCADKSDKAYILKGDRALTEKCYVQMTEKEKRELVEMLTDNYRGQAGKTT